MRFLRIFLILVSVNIPELNKELIKPLFFGHHDDPRLVKLTVVAFMLEEFVKSYA